MILADENIARAIVERLRADGHDVEWVAELAPSITDVDVLAGAFRAGRLLLTNDKDFGELVVREAASHRGVVLLRLAGVPTAARAELVSQLFRAGTGPLEGAFTVLFPEGRVRTRRRV